MIDTKLKGLYGQGERNSGIAKDGSLQTVDLDSPAGVFDILAVKKRIWSTAADVASMLLLGMLLVYFYDCRTNFV